MRLIEYDGMGKADSYQRGKGPLMGRYLSKKENGCIRTITAKGLVEALLSEKQPERTGSIAESLRTLSQLARKK